MSLEPDPIPLDVKVVLFGDRLLYYLLSALDPELGEHFKVLADFDDDLDAHARERGDAGAADRLASRARDGLRPLDRGGVGARASSMPRGWPTTPAS